MTADCTSEDILIRIFPRLMLFTAWMTPLTMPAERKRPIALIRREYPSVPIGTTSLSTYWFVFGVMSPSSEISSVAPPIAMMSLTETRWSV